MNTLNSLSFITFDHSKKFPYNVGDTEVDFYPVSVKCIYLLKSVAPKISNLVTVLMANTDQDSRTLKKSTVAAQKNASVTEVEIDAVPLDVLQFRQKSKQHAVSEIVLFLDTDEGKKFVEEMVFSSLQIPKKDRMPLDDLMESMPLDLFIDTIMGCVNANKKILGPFLDPLQQKLKGLMGEIQEKVAPETLNSQKMESDSGDSSQSS